MIFFFFNIYKVYRYTSTNIILKLSTSKSSFDSSPSYMSKQNHEFILKSLYKIPFICLVCFICLVWFLIVRDVERFWNYSKVIYWHIYGKKKKKRLWHFCWYRSYLKTTSLPTIPRLYVELGNVLVQVLDKGCSGHERRGGRGVGHQGKRAKIFG